MNNQLLTFFISIVTAGITAIITYTVSVKTSFRNKELELKREQAFKYFLPLKFIADELFHRLSHIEKKIQDKQDINLQLPQNLDEKDFKWFFTDWIDYKQPSKGAGGYFLTTAMFMHAQLYYRINLLLKEYPFLKVKLSQSISEYMDTPEGSEIKRYYKEIINDSHTKRWLDLEKIINLKGTVNLESLINSTRLAAVMKGGIPYGLQPAFGQFLEKSVNGKIDQLNYEEFVRLLMDKEQRVKFSPLQTFYSEIIDNAFKVDENKLIKMKALMICLLTFRNAELI
jgi:hypothetical protein